MRLASVNQDAGAGPERAKGAAVHVAAMRRAFAERGAEVIALDEPDERRLEARLADAERERGLDLVYERYALGRAAAARFAVGRGIPYVVEANAPLAEEAERWRGGHDSEGARREDRFLFGVAASVFAVSRGVADYVRARGARPERVEVVPNGVDARRFSPERRAEWGEQSPVPPGRFVIGFHGRLRPWHGFELFVAACGRLLHAGVDLHVLTVGEGEFAAALDGALPAVRRTHAGWTPHDDVGRYVALFDALPLTYPRDLPCYFSPLKLVEAMAAGAVPVVPASGDLAAIVGDGGLVYPPGDLEALVAALARLARAPASRAALAHAARARAERSSWTAIADRVLAAAATEAPR